MIKPESFFFLTVPLKNSYFKSTRKRSMQNQSLLRIRKCCGFNTKKLLTSIENCICKINVDQRDLVRNPIKKCKSFGSSLSVQITTKNSTNRQPISSLNVNCCQNNKSSMNLKNKPGFGRFQTVCPEQNLYQINLNSTNFTSEQNKAARNTHGSLLEPQQQSQLYQQQGQTYSTSIDTNRRQGELGIFLNICECWKDEQDKLEVTVEFSKRNFM